MKSGELSRCQQLVECPCCKRPPDAVNHVPGCIFVGLGQGWQTCPHCNGSQLVPESRA
jgi:hypothetical protein